MRAASLALMVGMACLQQKAALPAWPLAWLTVGGIVSFLAIRCRRQALVNERIWQRRFAYLLLLLGGVMAGFGWAAWRAEIRMQQSLPPEWEGRDVLVKGVIDSLPVDVSRGMRFTLRVEATEPPAAPVPEHIMLTWGQWGGAIDDKQRVILRPGERWQLPVRLKRPHGNANPHGFDYELWLLEQGVRATGYVREGIKALPAHFVPRRLTDAGWEPLLMVDRMRQQLRDRILRMLPEGAPYAGIVVALVMGDQGGIAQSDWDVFRQTGISHLVSISGLHITLVAGLFAAGVGWLWRHSFFTRARLPLYLPAQQAAVLAGAVVALLYCLIAGFQVPAQRTLYMLSVVGLAVWCGRVARPSDILCWALALVLILDPWAVLAPGFWLSFGAVSIIFYAMQGRIVHRRPDTVAQRIAWHVRTAGRVQWAVTVGLVPLTLLLFQQVSVVSPLANTLAIPVVSWLVTPLALLGSVLPAPLGNALLSIAHSVLGWLVSVLTQLAEQPFAVWQAPVPEVWMLGLAGAAVLWLCAPGPWRWGLPARGLALPLLIPLLYAQSSVPAPGEFRVTALDVGQGMGVLVETAGHRLLYDTGPQYSADSDAGGRIVMPYLQARGIHVLDTLVVSHQDNDHAGGAISILQAMPVRQLLASLPPVHAVRQLAVRQGAKDQPCTAGLRWVWDGIVVEVLHPVAVGSVVLHQDDGGGSHQASRAPKPNTRSCVVRVSNPHHAILLSGDIEAGQEREMLSRLSPDQLLASILLVPHHGSGTSSTAEFIDAVRPRWALFQVGYRNRFGHPQAQVVARYAERGAMLLRSDTAGAVTLETRGTAMLTESWRQGHQRYWNVL